MINDKYLYFRTQADQADDDGIDDSLYLPARQIRAIVPTSTTAGFGHAVLCAANDYEIVLDANLADSAGEVGSWITITKLASNEWMVDGCVYSDDADSDGTALFTNS